MTAIDIFLILLALIGALIVFGVTVSVHELGHFLAARYKGLVVETFAIGFGPTIWGKKINGVEYAIKAIPLGGFVSLPQMAPMEMVEGETQQKSEDLPPASPWAKIVTAFWGPMFSLFLAFACACILSLTGKYENIALRTTEIGFVLPDSPAYEAGIRPGDVVRSINGQPVTRWVGQASGVREAVVLSIGQTVSVDIERDGVLTTYKLIPSTDPELENLRTFGFELAPAAPVIVDSTLQGSPAERAGLLPGDLILRADGEKVYSLAQISHMLADRAGEDVILSVERDGQVMDLAIAPLFEAHRNQVIFGFSQKHFFELYYPGPFTQVRDAALLMGRTLNALVNRDSGVGVRHMSGPLGIFNHLARLVDDPRNLLAFSVFLNVNLAILNLLPLPILDGGHIVLSTVEWLRRRPTPVKVLYALQSAFFVVLICLVLFITYFDAGRVWKDWTLSRQYKAIPEEPRFILPENTTPTQE